ncbi:hypothetical protein [Thermococcus barophilus]|uniref:Lipoprotein n=1 Tax=Thermococcus barophilus TaxID=55802 RepID=A0A0S1XAT0_THEBA|nr:hypothetical protein [Thermococcus barophilus]ALM74843.1 conserved exported hypothetical protein [Thermococcus barophilus]
MKKIFVFVLIGLMVLSAGCIRKEGSLIIIDLSELSNLTEKISNQTAENQTAENQTSELHVYEELVQVGKNLTIKELNFTIKPDYDVSKGKFFFITPKGIFWEPMNITAEDVTILGKEYFAGTSVYIANITIISPRELTITVEG